MPKAYIDERGDHVKLCLRCRLVLPVSSYTRSTKDGSDGLRGVCRDCGNRRGREHYQRTIEYQRARSLAKTRTGAGKLYSRRAEMRRKYGLTPEQVDAMKEARGHRCDICKAVQTTIKPGTNLNVDHCHTEGTIRGMLCSACNKGLGMFRDNTATMRAAIEYLERSRT